MFGFLEGPKFNPSDDIPDLSGKVIIVTGGTSGLGAESALQLSKHNPSRIYITARDASKADAEIAKIKQAVPNANVQPLALDLSSLDSVKKAADTFQASESRLDILMNNAGIMATAPGLTKDGYEIQFGTNHIGHALFTKLLMPTLEHTASLPGADVRIINLSSAGHKMAPAGGFLPDEATTTMEPFSTWTRYGHSKLANVLFTQELARRYPAIKSFAISPGGVNTNLSSGFVAHHPWLSLPLAVLLAVITVPVEQGAWNQLWAATSKDAVSGAYYAPVGKVGSASKYVEDASLPGKLWEWTEKEQAKNGY